MSDLQEILIYQKHICGKKWRFGLRTPTRRGFKF